jgi:hypothetical protein
LTDFAAVSIITKQAISRTGFAGVAINIQIEFILACFTNSAVLACNATLIDFRAGRARSISLSIVEELTGLTGLEVKLTGQAVFDPISAGLTGTFLNG